jgi:hypothetical protein
VGAWQVTCYVAVLIPTAMRSSLVAEAELAIERHVLGTGPMHVSSPATFWAWLHGQWLPQLHQLRNSFPPSGALMYDRRQRPVIGAYGNAYLVRPRPLEDPSGANANSAFWGVGMVLRQHRVAMTNCSSVFAGVNRFAPAKVVGGDAANAAGAGKCHEKKLLAEGDSWALTQYTSTTRSTFTMSECAIGCALFGAEGCTAWIVTDGDGFLTARYTDAGISGAKVPAEHPRLSASKQLEPPSASRTSTCFLVGADESPFSCGAQVVASADAVPARGDACVNGVEMTVFRPTSCPAGAHLCAPPYSPATKDVTAKRWDGREGFGFRAANGGWQRRKSVAALEAQEAEPRWERRDLTDWTSLATSNSSVGANSSKTGAGGLDVERYGDPWQYTEGSERLWGGPWSGGGASVGRLTMFPGGGYGVDLLQEGGVGGITSDLEKSGWLDRATRAVSLDMWAILPQSGHVTKVTILFELALGGHWIPSVSLSSGPLMGAAREAAAAADAYDASRPTEGVNAGKVARGVGDWVGMEVFILVLQSLVLLAVFVWASAYALIFHPRALVPRLVLVIVGHVYSFSRMMVRGVRRGWAACWHAGGNLAKKGAQAGQAAMEENRGIKKSSPRRQAPKGWLNGHMQGEREEGASDEQGMLSVMLRDPDQHARAGGSMLRKDARLEEEVEVQDVDAGDGGAGGGQSFSRARQVVSPSEVDPMHELHKRAAQVDQPPLGPDIAKGAVEIPAQAQIRNTAALAAATHGWGKGQGRADRPVRQAAGDGRPLALGLPAHSHQPTVSKQGWSRAPSEGGISVKSVAWSTADEEQHDAGLGGQELVRTSLTRQAMSGGWIGGELWPFWDATCFILLFSRLLLELLRVFGGPRAGAGAGASADKETGWWVGGGDFLQQQEQARSSDVMGALAFVLLLLGGLRFWRCSRVMVMFRRLCIKAAPAVVGVLGLVLLVLSANASRRMLLHVHSPDCQPSWGEIFANSLDQLLAFDGAGVATEVVAGVASQVPGNAHARVGGAQFWRRGRPARLLPPASFPAHIRRAAASATSGEWGVFASRVGGQEKRRGRGCYDDGVWPRAPASDTSSHWIRSINEMMSHFEVAITALILAPLVFCVILHAWNVTSQPDTRNMRPPTDRERRLYSNVLWQDCIIFAEWAKWMWYEINEQLWAYHHSVPRDFLALPDIPPFDPSYDASEYEPYTDADCWRSVFEVVHEVDAHIDQRIQAAEGLMLRSVAPLIATLDKLKYLPIDPEESPYPAAAQGPAAHQGAATLHASPATRSPGARRPEDDTALSQRQSPGAHRQSEQWELQELQEVEDLEDVPNGGDDDDVSEVATVVDAGERVSKGADLRVVAKVVQLRSVSSMVVPRPKGSFFRKALTLGEHCASGFGLAFEFSLHGQVP